SAGQCETPDASPSRLPPPVVIIAAIALTLVATGIRYAGVDISPFEPVYVIRRAEYWRLITSVFLPVDAVHLAFHLFWLWVFGTQVEQAFGHIKTAALLALFATGASATEFALKVGGIGLSGAVFGLLGMLCVLSRRDGRFTGAVGSSALLVFAAWLAYWNWN